LLMIETSTKKQLTRTLGLPAALGIGIGTMIGAGIFVLPGLAAEKAGGSAVIFSFMICGLVALFTALCTAEIATGMPKSGGGYYFISRAFGPLAAAVIGWSLWAGLIFATAFYLMGYIEYIRAVLPSGALGWAIYIGLATAVALIVVNYTGAKKTGVLQTWIVVVLLVILFIFILLGFFRIDTANFRPFAARGFGPVMGTSAILLITYCGFAQIASVAGEIKDPGKNLPRALIGSVVFTAVLYCLIMLVILGMTRFGERGSPLIIVELGRSLLGGPGGLAIVLGGILATLSSANASVMAASRICYTMGRDRIFFRYFETVHPRYLTPAPAIVLTGALIIAILLVGVVMGTLFLETLAAVAGLFHLIMYALINLSCLALRIAGVEWYKPSFRTPLYPAIPILGLLGCASVAVMAGLLQWAIAVVIIGAALLWYLLVTKRTPAIKHARAEILEKTLDRVQEGVKRHVERTRKEAGEIKGRVLVTVANPDTLKMLIDVASPLASFMEIIHVFEVSPEISLVDASRICREKYPGRWKIVGDASRYCEDKNIPHRARVMPSHNMIQTIAQEGMDATYILIGWHGKLDRASLARSRMRAIAKNVGGNLLILKTDPGTGLGKKKKILLPYAGGIHARLGLNVAQQIARAWGAELQVAKVVVAGKEKLKEALARQEEKLLSGLLDEKSIEAGVRVIHAKSVEDGILDVSSEYDLVIIGASGEWKMKRKLSGSIPDRVTEKAGCSVLVVRTERGDEGKG